MRGKSLGRFIALGILFIFMRLLPVFTAVERVSHYDELDLGVIAGEWLHGPRLPLWHYQMDPYGGESIVLGALAVPFVKFLGATLLAVKIPSLLFAFFLFSLIYLFLNLNFGLTAAVWGSLLLIFAPPSFVQFSLAGLSGHGESLAFAAGALLFFYDFIFGSKKKRSLFLFAAVSGFGFWFYNETAVILFTLLLSWLILDRKSFFSFHFLIFLSGLALGLTPWFGYTHYYGSEGFSFTAGTLSQVSENMLAVHYLASKTFKLFFQWMPFSFAFFPVLGIHEKAYSLIYFCAAYLPLLPLAFTQRHDRKSIPLLLFPAVFSAALILSVFSIAADIGFIGYRYLAPLQLFMMLLAVVLTLKLKIQKFFLPALILLGFLGQTSLIFKEPFGRAQTYKGYSYYRVGTQWFHTLPPKVQSAEDLARELSKRDPKDAYFLLWGMASVGMGSKVDALLPTADPPLSLEQARPFLPLSSNAYLDEWKTKLAIPEENPGNASLSPEESAKKFLTLIWDSNTLFNRDVETALRNLRGQDREMFFRGLGWAVRAIHREDPVRAQDWIETFPHEYKSHALEGAEDFDRMYNIPDQ